MRYCWSSTGSRELQEEVLLLEADMYVKEVEGAEGQESP